LGYVPLAKVYSGFGSATGYSDWDFTRPLRPLVLESLFNLYGGESNPIRLYQLVPRNGFSKGFKG
jgi:hypothetical protein